VIDNTPPVVTFSLPATVKVGDVVPIDYTCADSGSGIASCSGDVASGTNLDTSSARTVTITVTATDAVGNQSTVSHTVRVRQGPSTPGAPAASPAPNAGTFTVSWAASIDEPGIDVTYDLQRATDPSGPWTTVAQGLTSASAPQSGLAQGVYFFQVTAKDDFTSTTSAASAPVLVDTTPPAPVITGGCPTTHPAPGTSVTVTFTASDGGGSGLATPASGAVSAVLGNGPTQSIDVVAQDNAGNTATASCVVTVNTPPSKPGAPSASPSPNPGVFTLGWAASTDADHDAITYTLQHRPAAGGSFTTVATGLAAPTYSFTAGSRELEGTWVYEVTPHDATNAGLASDVSAAVVVDRTQPNAPTLVASGAPIGGWFKDSTTVTTQPNGDPALPDGSPGSGIDPSKTTAPQTVSTTATVTGSVSDRAGNSRSATLVVRVDASAPELVLICPAIVPLGLPAVGAWGAADAGSGLSGPPLGLVDLPTSTAGAKTSPAVTVTDNVGHTTTKTCSYTVAKGTPLIAWNPASLLFGGTLGAAQLNAKATLNGASVAGTFSYTPSAGTVVQPGQTVTVTFTPADTADYTAATKTVSMNVTFTQPCLTKAENGSLSIKSGTAYCISDGGTVNGSISVAAGAALYVNGGVLHGSLSVSGATAFTACGSSLNGSLSVANSTGYVLIGGSYGSVSCAGNQFSGAVSISGNTGGVSFVGNVVNGSVSITSNVSHGQGYVFSGNRISGASSQKSNS
jgi:hypothetical protein